MSEKKYIDYQLHFDKRVAREYGVNEAIVINTFQKLIGYNKSMGRNYYQGRTWTFNSYEEWTEEKYFSCFSKEQMRRVLDSLISKGVLIKGNFNRQKNDKTNWYAFVEEERWIEKDSPIPNYGSERPGGLPESADQNGTLFDSETLPESADQKEENALPKSADGNLGEIPLPNSTEQKEVTVEIGSETAGIGKAICPNRQIDLPESAKHYHINNISLQENTAVVNSGGDVESKDKILARLVKLQIIDAVEQGYAEKLSFSFNDDVLVRKNLDRLFRIFVGMNTDVFNNINVERILAEMNDSRMELNPKICWLIIEHTFADYPSWKKDFKNIISLERRIQKQKDRYYAAYYERKNSKEAAAGRAQAAEQRIIDAEQLKAQGIERIEKMIDENKGILTAKKINDVRRQMKSSVILAEGMLVDYLESNGVEV